VASSWNKRTTREHYHSETTESPYRNDESPTAARRNLVGCRSMRTGSKRLNKPDSITTSVLTDTIFANGRNLPMFFPHSGTMNLPYRNDGYWAVCPRTDVLFRSMRLIRSASMSRIQWKYRFWSVVTFVSGRNRFDHRSAMGARNHPHSGTMCSCLELLRCLPDFGQRWRVRAASRSRIQ